MSGPGLLTLAGSNTYTGGTTVNAGMLLATIPASLPGYSTSGSVTVGSAATLAIQTGSGATGWNSGQIDTVLAKTTWADNTAALGIDTTNSVLGFTYTTSITQPISLTKLGPNTLTLTGSNTYAGVTTVSGGTLSIGNGGSGASIGGTSGVVLANGANITFNHADPVSFAAPISGSGSLLKTGNGTLSLTNFNTYTGATIVSGGRLQLGPAPGPAGILANSVLWVDPSGLTPGSYSTINNLGTGGSNFTDSASGVTVGSGINGHNAFLFTGNDALTSATAYANSGNSMTIFTVASTAGPGTNDSAFNGYLSFTTSPNANDWDNTGSLGAITTDNHDNFGNVRSNYSVTGTVPNIAGDGTPMPQGPNNAFITTQTFDGTTSTFSVTGSNGVTTTAQACPAAAISASLTRQSVREKP